MSTIFTPLKNNIMCSVFQCYKISSYMYHTYMTLYGVCDRLHFLSPSFFQNIFIIYLGATYF